MMKMKVRVFENTVTSDNTHVLHAINEGIGLTEDCAIVTKGYELCDVAVIQGGIKYKTTANGLEIAGSTTRARKPIIDKHPHNLLVVESAVFRRNREESKTVYRRLGWRGFLFDEANFMNSNSPSDRWERISKEQNLVIKPWRTTGDHIVVIMQKENDSSLRGIDINDWANKVVAEIKKYSTRSIIVRPHPLNKREYPPIEGTITSTKKLLEDDLEGAWAVVSYSSLSSVEAICDGIPVFASGRGNMAWPVANHKLSDIENPLIPERNQWLYDLAYTQWHVDEFKDGTAWNHLKDGYIAIQSSEDSQHMNKSFSGEKKKK